LDIYKERIEGFESLKVRVIANGSMKASEWLSTIDHTIATLVTEMKSSLTGNNDAHVAFDAWRKTVTANNALFNTPAWLQIRRLDAADVIPADVIPTLCSLDIDDMKKVLKGLATDGTVPTDIRSASIDVLHNAVAHGYPHDAAAERLRLFGADE
jgi:hypothetical protein